MKILTVCAMFSCHANKGGTNESNNMNEFYNGYLTKTEVAGRLRKSKRTIDEWGSKGILPYIKIRRSVLFKWPDVVQALQKFERKGGEL